MKLFKRAASYFAEQKLTFSLCVICAVITGSFQLVLPYLTGLIIDEISGKGTVNFGAMGKLSLLMGGAVIAAALFWWLCTLLAGKLSYAIGASLRVRFMEKLNTLPVSYFDKNAHGDLVSRVSNDVETITEGLREAAGQLFIGVVMLIGSFALMLSLNPVITLIVGLLTPLAFLLSSFIVKRIDKTFNLQQKQVGDINAFAKEIIDGQKTVKAYTLEKSSYERFKNKNVLLYKYGQKAQFYSSLVNPVTRLVNSTTYITVGVVAGLLAAKGVNVGGKAMSVGLIAAFLSYALQFAKPINDITNITSQLQAAAASFRRIFEVLDEDSMPEESPNMPALNYKSGNIEFKNISFSYRKGNPVIKNVSLKIPVGSKVAVVGPTGAGKTTLVNLLMRFYDIDSGEIIIGDKNISRVSVHSLRTSFAMVLQDTFLFNDTVKNNIAYGKPDASDEEIIAAAKAAYAHSFIKRLPDGYDTVISLNGSELSAGQKQLITIARAMLVNPPMLILDEATSSVDTLTEAKISMAFKKMMKNKLSFIIAHRLSTIVDSDIILVMDKGNIVETGTHRQLLERGGLYKELYNSQFEK